VQKPVITDTGEPHAQRRRALLALHPEVRSLFGFDRRTAWVTAAVVVAQLAIAWLVGQEARAGGWIGSAWAIVILAYAVGAVLTHWLSMSIHETSHRLAARTARGNDAVALLANVPMILPVAMTFNRYHIAHHRELGVLGGDTDLPLPIEARIAGRSRLLKALLLFFHPVVYLLRGLTFAKPPNRAELLNLAFIAVVDVALWYALGPTAFAYLALSFFFAHGLNPVAGHFIHEHYTFAEGQETFSYYGPLNWVTFNVGYHNEHHDFMNVPGWRLPELRKMVSVYDELVSHRSWTAILFRFIFDRSLGYTSRIVRTRASFDRARAAHRRERRTTHVAA
jgi:sphingolipid delta-4 desaturase